MASLTALSPKIHSTSDAPLDLFDQRSTAIDKKIDEIWGSAFMKCGSIPLLTIHEALANPSLDDENAQSSLVNFKLDLINAKLEIKEMLHGLRRQQTAFNEQQKKQTEAINAKIKSNLAALIQKTIDERRKEDEARKFDTRLWYA